MIPRSKNKKRKSHQPSGLRWLRVEYWSQTPSLLPSGMGLPSPYPLPRALDPWCRDTLGCLISIFWPSCCLPFLHRFFDALLARFWLHFASQLGPQNPPKSIKIDAQIVSLAFFDRLLVPTSVPENQQIIKIPFVLSYFLVNWAFRS